MPIIGAVADDLTGANTTGVLLARSKARTAVFFNEKAALKAKGVAELDAILISSNSRPMPPAAAKAYVTDATLALKNMGVKYFSKRIDTTLRGGIGHEIDAMLDVIGEDAVAVVVPAMPQSRRIVVGGYSVIDNVALIRTPVAQDVRTPVRENYVPKLLDAQTTRKVGLVTLGDVLDGVPAIKTALKAQRENGAEVIVVDAITIEDVEAIARAVVELGWNVLAVDKACLLIQSGDPPRAILFETALHGTLLNLDEEDAKRAYTGGTCADLINIGLGLIVSGILRRVGRDKIAGLYTTGGDTMVNVCSVLGVECLEVMDYVIPQTDIGRLIGAYDGLPIIGKGGLTGTNTTAIEIVDRLMREAARK